MKACLVSCTSLTCNGPGVSCKDVVWCRLHERGLSLASPWLWTPWRPPKKQDGVDPHHCNPETSMLSTEMQLGKTAAMGGSQNILRTGGAMV